MTAYPSCLALSIVHDSAYCHDCEAEPVDEFLKTEMALRHWTKAKLAEECDVSESLVSKWVSDDPRRRVLPSPQSCAKIAAALGADLDQVLALAGHRVVPASTSSASRRLDARRRAVQDQFERWIAAVGPEYEEYFWRHLKAQGDSTVALIRGMGTAVSTPSDAAVNAAVSQPLSTDERPDDNAGGRLSRSYPRSRFPLSAPAEKLNAAVAA
jgi:transcriptional regulator with XRE-family HTH domain